MRILRLGLLVIVASLFAMGCSKTDSATANQARPAGSPVGSGASPATASLDEFAAVRVIFAKDCVSCHAADGAGGPVKLEDGTMLKVPSLREGHALKHDDAELFKQITKGGDGMPKFEDKLSREDIVALTRFIRKELQGR
jgi:mono/diheme cytochrome c family protein